MFIALNVDAERCLLGQGCAECIEVCPVDIFEARDGRVAIDHEKEDECTLCDLCLKSCSAKVIEIEKLYEA